MQVKETANAGLKKTLDFTVDAAEINQTLEKELKNIGKDVKIAGFRPGHVPINVLKQRYGKAVEADVVHRQITESVNKALSDKKLRPATQPNVTKQDYKEGGELSFTVDVEVLPEVPEIKFDGITLDRQVFDVVDSDIDDALVRLAERSPTSKALPAETKAKKGSVLNVDFKGTIDGVAFEGGTAEKFTIEIGSGRLIEGFEDQLIGAKAGDDVVVKVSFPKEYFNAKVAGKPAEFAVKVHEVAELVTPEIDEDFAKSRGFSDLRAFKEAVRDQLNKEFTQIVRTHVKKELFDVLNDKYAFELPPSMVKGEYDAIMARVNQAKEDGDEELKAKSDKELETEYKGIAERRVRLGILLAEIGTREKLQATREEMGQALVQHASQYPGQEQRVIEFYRSNPERLDELRGPILEEKSVDFILSKVKFNDKKVSTKDLMEGEVEEGEKPKKKAAKKSKKDE